MVKKFNCFVECKFPDCICSSHYIQNKNKCKPLYKLYYELLSKINLHIKKNSEILQHTFTNDLHCPSGWALCTIGDTGSCYPNENICVFERNILGAPLHCKNTEHLIDCYDHQCPTQFKCRETFCIPIHMLCDGVSDCPDHEDACLQELSLAKCRQLIVNVFNNENLDNMINFVCFK